MDILKQAPSTPSGIYGVKPAGSSAAFEVYCDMETDGGGWAYVGRGSATSKTNNAFGTMQTNPGVNTRWRFDMDVINALGSDLTISNPKLEYFVSMGANNNNGYKVMTDFRIFQTDPGTLTFMNNMDSSVSSLTVWNGAGWVDVTYTCNHYDVGPCWEPTAGQNMCCNLNNANEWYNCKDSTLNYEGQWSHSNTNQHLRCSENDYDQDQLVIYVRPKSAGQPTQKPTNKPTAYPTQKPSDAPTAYPTQKPSDAPTQKPTQKPTKPNLPIDNAVLNSGVDNLSGASVVLAKVKMMIQLKTTVSGFASVGAFDESAQSNFKDNVAAASSLVESADDVEILAVTETVRRRALLDVSLDVDYTVTVDVDDESTGALQLGNDISTNGPGVTSVEGTTVVNDDGGTGAICFTGESLLTLEDGSTKNFHNLKVGDMILGADRNGTISASPVIFIPHPTNYLVRQFDEVELVNGMIVRMTRNHLLPLCDGSLVTARSLSKGDCLMTTSGLGKVAGTTKNVEASGIYTAVTKNEFLVVDGIVASPFALAHGIAHSLFDREDVAEWCKDNAHLVKAATDKNVQQSRRRLLLESTDGCMELMETLFENYKDEGVGWGTNGWGYENFKTEKTSLAMRLSGFKN